jgi:hypothetical protein
MNHVCAGFSNDLHLFNKCDQGMVSELYFCTATAWHRKDCLMQCVKTGREAPRCASCKQEVKNVRRTAERMALRSETHKKVSRSFPTKESIVLDLQQLYQTDNDEEQIRNETAKLFQLAHALQIDIGEVVVSKKNHTVLYKCPFIELEEIGFSADDTKTSFCNYPQTSKHTIVKGTQLKHQNCPSFVVYSGTNSRRKFCRQCYLLLRQIKIAVEREKVVSNITTSTIPNYALTRRELESKCAQQHADLVKAKQLFNNSLKENVVINAGAETNKLLQGIYNDKEHKLKMFALLEQKYKSVSGKTELTENKSKN